MARKPIPVKPEASAMPTNNCFWRYDYQGLFPFWPHPAHNDPKTADQCEQVWALTSGAAEPKAVDEGPDFLTGGHVESRGSVETDLLGAET